MRSSNARPVFRLKQITTYPKRSEPDTQVVFHLTPGKGPEAPFQMPLRSLLGIIDALIVAGVVPAWRDKGNWRWRAGTRPRCGEQMQPSHEIMLDAMATRNRKRGCDVQRLVQLEVFEPKRATSRLALVPVSVLLQCLCAAATLEAVPPLDPNWARVAIPDWIATSVRHQTVMKNE